MEINHTEWYYNLDHNDLCRVIETQTLWGETVCRVWMPSKNAVVRVSASRLKPLSEIKIGNKYQIAYLASAARIADSLTQDVLLAPIESSVIPLPHQVNVLSKAVSSNRVRYLLADEVGLGKTIEAGLIMRELKLRGLVKRTLVVVPKGLVAQWIAEMRFHFKEEFRLIIPSDFSAYRRIASEENLWQIHPQVICSMDSVKPLDNRRGWSMEQVAEYNKERFENLVSAGWDLIIVDEAHRLSGSTDQVARYKLGLGLSEAAPYLLLLSATPHQGKTDAFHRLLSLIDAQAFPDVGSVSKERVQPYVIRTEKRKAIDSQGQPLFKPRYTQLTSVSWGYRHRQQKLLYEEVTEYVREGYNKAKLEKRNYIGFLMILMQRLVVSSTRAIRTSLERRLEVLEEPLEQLSLFPAIIEEDWADLDGQEQIDIAIRLRSEALKDEKTEVSRLLDLAKDCESQSYDAKAEALVSWIYRLQADEGDPDLKVLVFTEFVPTQEMLYEFLTERGISAACLNGSMDMDERVRVQKAFAEDVRVLISTDAGGEGLNLQFCHVVINYDIPWNPMRLEQRIGRVDRIGQSHAVRAINFVFQDSVEGRVREVLEEKLDLIFREFGIDKTADVLDSAQAGQIFDDLYVEAILNPENVEAKVDEVIKSIREEAIESRQSASLLGSAGDLDPREAQRLLAHPFPYWVERMTINYILANGGKAEKKDDAWDLTWPDEEIMTDVVFSKEEAGKNPLSHYVTFEDSKVRRLAMYLPPFVPGQPIPVIALHELASEIVGFWSLWRISISTADWDRYRMMPLFLTDSDQVFIPTAKYIWDQLLTAYPLILRHLDIESSYQAFERLWKAGEQQGKIVYDELIQAHKEHLIREREKGEYAFAARRRTIMRIGLKQVRSHRLKLLDQEERYFYEELERKAKALPEMVPVLIARVEEGTNG
ncbi:DEAD/DEAH box helicase [Acetomicrobium sp.]|uniref:DEAD/DEAH box helicase n=1 Tax=Acetomicrobium sp. TaxID=1872099 RepID=UPI002B258AF7|nr:helicase-related protein [Acetomicrobium sp.]